MLRSQLHRSGRRPAFRAALLPGLIAIAWLVSGMPVARAQGESPAPSPDYAPVPTARKFAYVGGDYGTQERLERVPGRKFLDYQGQPTDAVRFMAACGLNAVRVFVVYGQPLTSRAVDNANVDHRELNFGLDGGGIDWQVDLARRARACGQKIILTLQFGQDKSVRGNIHENIPDAWLNYTYTQTLSAIDTNTRALLDPFLAAGIQPDIIVCENEADSGMLFQYVNSSGAEAERDSGNTSALDNTATGNETLWPKCTGYWKQEILSAKDEIARVYKLDAAATRFALHTTSNNARAHFKFDEVFENKHPDAEQHHYAKGIDQGPVTIIPENVRNTNLRDILDIMSFSYYPNQPVGGVVSDFDAALAGKKGGMSFTRDMEYFNSKIPAFGRYESGPFKGQFRKQVLILEYATTGGQKTFSIDRQNAFTTYFFNQVAGYEWMLGAMWWEPTYAHNNWNGGHGSLYRASNFNAQTHAVETFTPTTTLKVWGSFAAPLRTPVPRS